MKAPSGNAAPAGRALAVAPFYRSTVPPFHRATPTRRPRKLKARHESRLHRRRSDAALRDRPPASSRLRRQPRILRGAERHGRPVEVLPPLRHAREQAVAQEIGGGHRRPVVGRRLEDELDFPQAEGEPEYGRREAPPGNGAPVELISGGGGWRFARIVFLI